MKEYKSNYDVVNDKLYDLLNFYESEIKVGDILRNLWIPREYDYIKNNLKYGVDDMNLTDSYLDAVNSNLKDPILRLVNKNTLYENLLKSMDDNLLLNTIKMWVYISANLKKVDDSMYWLNDREKDRIDQEYKFLLKNNKISKNEIVEGGNSIVLYGLNIIKKRERLVTIVDDNLASLIKCTIAEIKKRKLLVPKVEKEHCLYKLLCSTDDLKYGRVKYKEIIEMCVILGLTEDEQKNSLKNLFIEFKKENLKDRTYKVILDRYLNNFKNIVDIANKKNWYDLTDFCNNEINEIDILVGQKVGKDKEVEKLKLSIYNMKSNFTKGLNFVKKLESENVELIFDEVETYSIKINLDKVADYHIKKLNNTINKKDFLYQLENKIRLSKKKDEIAFEETIFKDMMIKSDNNYIVFTIENKYNLPSDKFKEMVDKIIMEELIIRKASEKIDYQKVKAYQEEYVLNQLMKDTIGKKKLVKF